MQTLARVNRTFRGKDAGLLVGYAPLLENLQAALSEYSAADQQHQPMGRNVAEAVALVEILLGSIREALAGLDWRRMILPGHPRSYLDATNRTANYLRDVATPGNRVDEGERLVDRFRSLSSQLARAWALCTGSDELAPVRFEVQFYEEVRVCMAKFDANARRASGEPIPAEVARLLAALIADNAHAGEVLDIYQAAGMEKPALSELNAGVRRQGAEAQQLPARDRGAAGAGDGGGGAGDPEQRRSGSGRSPTASPS